MVFDLQTIFTDPGILSLIFFALCFALTTFTSRKGFVKGHTARAVRAEYRRSWAESVVRNGDRESALSVFRNNIMVSSTILGGLVIAVGLVANAAVAASSEGVSLHMIFLIILMTYAIFSILMEIRALTYLPILLGTSGKLIEKNEDITKEEYISKLLDNTYDDFSDAMRALFFMIALLVFSFDKILFIAVTISLTYLFVRRDLSEKSRIEIF